MLQKIKINNEEIREYLKIDVPEFPKYVTQILNLANQNAQGTRPKVVGQMSELIKQFNGKKVNEWEIWYKNKYPLAIRNATQKILDMVENLKNALNQINEETVGKWVKDLVIAQTFMGLKFQEAILKKVAEIKKCNYRLATFKEEAIGIDGYIGETPVSIKPESYKLKPALGEKIAARVIYYTKTKDGIVVNAEEIFK